MVEVRLMNSAEFLVEVLKCEQELIQRGSLNKYHCVGTILFSSYTEENGNNYATTMGEFLYDINNPNDAQILEKGILSLVGNWVKVYPKSAKVILEHITNSIQ